MLAEIYKNNKPFLIPYLLFLAIGIPIVVFYSKGDIHLAINNYNYYAADYFFKYLTYLGSGLSPFLVGIAVMLISFRKAIFTAAAATLAGILVQILKILVFPDVSRPLAYFKDHSKLHLVDGVDIYHSFSFPSGHSATIFALCFSISLLIKNQSAKTLLFFIALLVGLSRVYLSQHFINDVLAGSIIGVISVPVMKSLTDRIKGNWADRSLKDIFVSFKKDI
jgi:membrane-associated phospholipid phosphatase